jgi:hypothetical protein
MLTRTPEPDVGPRRSRTEPRAICVGLLAGLALVSALSHVCFGTGGADREYLATRGYGQYLPDTPWRVHRGGRTRSPAADPRVVKSAKCVVR